MERAENQGRRNSTRRNQPKRITAEAMHPSHSVYSSVLRGIATNKRRRPCAPSHGVLIGPTRDRNADQPRVGRVQDGYSSVLRGIATRGASPRASCPPRRTHRSYEGSQPCPPNCVRQPAAVLIGPTRDRNSSLSPALPASSPSSTHRSYEGSQRGGRNEGPLVVPHTHRSYEGSQLERRVDRGSGRRRYSSVLRGIANPIFRTPS